MTVTSFNDWLLAYVSGTDYDDVWDLYHSVLECDEYGIFKTTKNEQQGKYFVKCAIGEDTLMLASEKARETFLKVVEQTYCGEMDIEGYYAFHKAMEKDD